MLKVLEKHFDKENRGESSSGVGLKKTEWREKNKIDDFETVTFISLQTLITTF